MSSFLPLIRVGGEENQTVLINSKIEAVVGDINRLCKICTKETNVFIRNHDGSVSRVVIYVSPDYKSLICGQKEILLIDLTEVSIFGREMYLNSANERNAINFIFQDTIQSQDWCAFIKFVAAVEQN